MSRKTTPAGPPPPGFTPGPRHKVFGISDDLLNTTRAILMGVKPEAKEAEEEADENKQELAETKHKYAPQKVENKVVDHSGDGEVMSVRSHDDHHVFTGSSGDRHDYHVHDSKSGKTHSVNLPNKKLSHAEVKHHFPSHPDSVTKTIHQHHKDEVDWRAKQTNEALSHNCANHVKSEQWGDGQCIPGMHTIEEISEEEGVVTHYDVMFDHGIEEDVPVEDLEIVSEKHHSHKKSMKEDDDDNGNGDDDENGNGKSKKKSKKSKKLDKVDPDELEGSHDERDDEDIDNDDDVDASDKYLHKRRKAVHKAIKKDA